MLIMSMGEMSMGEEPMPMHDDMSVHHMSMPMGEVGEAPVREAPTMTGHAKALCREPATVPF